MKIEVKEIPIYECSGCGCEFRDIHAAMNCCDLTGEGERATVQVGLSWECQGCKEGWYETREEAENCQNADCISKRAQAGAFKAAELANADPKRRERELGKCAKCQDAGVIIFPVDRDDFSITGTNADPNGTCDQIDTGVPVCRKLCVHCLRGNQDDAAIAAKGATTCSSCKTDNVGHFGECAKCGALS